MTGEMTQKDHLARQREERRYQAFVEDLEKTRREACRGANAWARQQGVEPPFPDVEEGPSEDRQR